MNFFPSYVVLNIFFHLNFISEKKKSCHLVTNLPEIWGATSLCISWVGNADLSPSRKQQLNKDN